MTREDEIRARLEAQDKGWKEYDIFAYHAPDDIRYLLDRVVELEDDLDDYVAQVDHLTGAHDD